MDYRHIAHGLSVIDSSACETISLMRAEGTPLIAAKISRCSRPVSSGQTYIAPYSQYSRDGTPLPVCTRVLRASEGAHAMSVVCARERLEYEGKDRRHLVQA